MLLSNSSIIDAIEAGRLGIEPAPVDPRTNPEDSPYDTCAVDLTLGPSLQIPKNDLSVLVDFRRGNVINTLTSISKVETIDPTQGFTLYPQTFVLGQTHEIITLPLPHEFPEQSRGMAPLAARVEGKSSRARFGLLVHFTAPTIHAGWAGPITLEMMNFGIAPIVLYPGMPICQLLLEEVHGVPLESRSIFHNQATPAGQSDPA